MKKKILIVEDIYPNRFLLEQILSEYECLLASDGFQMKEILKKTIPDLILMDIGLPGEGGLSLAKGLAADPRYKDIPVIFLTAHSSKREIVEGMKAGGYDYIVKPIDDIVLLARIEAAFMKKDARK